MPTKDQIEKLYKKLNQDAKAFGYYLNPDVEFTKALVESLLVNEERFGYQACPCRRAAGVKEKDLDIICPCDYRDPDLSEYDTCYCCLYVSKAAAEGKKKVGSIPERRPSEEARKKMAEEKNENVLKSEKLSYPVWRCQVCGYLCAKENPPDTCPICKVGKERFEVFIR